MTVTILTTINETELVPVAIRCSRAKLYSNEAYAILTGFLPNYIRWGYRRLRQDIRKLNLVDSNISLFVHGPIKPGVPALLFLPGDEGAAPSNLLHLAERAEKMGFAVYSTPSTCHMESVVSRIHAIAQTAIIAVGHSFGATLATAHALEDSRIQAIISFAGRMRSPAPPSTPGMLPTLQKIESTPFEFPFFVIGGGLDEYMPKEAMLPPGKEFHLLLPRTHHLNLVFNPLALESFRRILESLRGSAS